ncbi:MAG TPA: nucleotidyltransferase domain-containing protein [Candidatus Lokiarchaeia archaeon]
MSNILNVDLSFIKNEYFKNTITQYIKKIFTIDYTIEGILLFGSVAKEIARDDKEYLSDIDLIVVAWNLTEDLWKRNDEVFKSTGDISSDIQALWWTPEEIQKNVETKFYLVLDALDDGKILYDPNNFLYELKKKLKKELKEKGVVKTEMYWQWPIKKFGDYIEF